MDMYDNIMKDALTDAAMFRTFDDDYEIIDRDQVQIALRNLDTGIRRFGLIYDIAQAASPSDKDSENLKMARKSIDAVFTALSIIKKNLEEAVEHKAAQTLDSINEMACYGCE
jgi:hypothetical protein